MTYKRFDPRSVGVAEARSVSSVSDFSSGVPAQDDSLTGPEMDGSSPAGAGNAESAAANVAKPAKVASGADACNHRCDVAGSGLAIAEPRDALAGGWCSHHYEALQLLNAVMLNGLPIEPFRALAQTGDLRAIARALVDVWNGAARSRTRSAGGHAPCGGAQTQRADIA